ncbi:hypothetical protein S7711_09494 [Stachybotrys chartarum IBT 7711]|uniref:Uncharacterized protein n=1 Tax=Stachybotrys chartarum (strain CBS 109288 / IBT 7711) TaxID=1280523 RepID=A0A084AND1_STACB|nr:hypothetical protein S7711_09494 [Stachybotrys chartarum IBT 7711]KFA51186.1 hypothetical protein S40293_09373 [Stachybotrys chartarum IBT 40293]
MRSTVACLARQPATPHRKFRRMVSAGGGVYYTLSRKKRNVPEDPDWFQLRNLHLDLDAEDCKATRLFDQHDQGQLQSTWGPSPVEAAVRDKVRSFKHQLAEARSKVHALASQPTNVWRLTPHDLLHVALRGAAPQPLTAGASQHDRRFNQKQDRSLEIISCLRHENGIPAHAATEDAPLLEWMSVRRTGLQKTLAKYPQQAPSIQDFAEALRTQTSIAGIRRLTFQCLSAGMDVAGFHSLRLDGPDSPNDCQPVSLSQEIRAACLYVLETHDSSLEAVAEALTLIGNLSARLSQCGVDVGAPLRGLAIRLSADAMAVDATSHHLTHGFSSMAGSEDVHVSADVLSALESYSSHLAHAGSGANTPPAANRQSLLQILTGIDENNQLAPESIRELTLAYLDQGTRGHELYKAYIMLLGHLGAVRTLWKEWRVSAGRLSAVSDTSLSSLQTLRLPEGVASIFASALQAALSVMAPLMQADGPDPSLEECIVLDYHSMQEQVGRGWPQIGQTRTPLIQENASVVADDICAALELPLNGWLGKLQPGNGAEVDH